MYYEKDEDICDNIIGRLSKKKKYYEYTIYYVKYLAYNKYLFDHDECKNSFMREINNVIRIKKIVNKMFMIYLTELAKLFNTTKNYEYLSPLTLLKYKSYLPDEILVKLFPCHKISGTHLQLAIENDNYYTVLQYLNNYSHHPNVPDTIVKSYRMHKLFPNNKYVITNIIEKCQIKLDIQNTI